MKRTTFDFGIDLGTTNSAIAELRGTEVVVHKNNEGQETTPSAVWMDKHNRIHVGMSAKNNLDKDTHTNNAFSEFKQLMGSDQEFIFERNNQKMKPEDLSAEVLKSLKGDIKQKIGEDISSVVITVPAVFQAPQTAATNEAAKLAGFKESTLLQEPIAAAMAYGFQSENDKVFWLVYDFGGGTFDAAIIQVRDGAIEVVNHDGDNELGGKSIDWEIVNELFVPILVEKFALNDFKKSNLKWKTAFAKLKMAAENVKIRVARADNAEIIIDYLCKDDNNEPVQFEIEITKQDVEKLAKPFIIRTLNICKKILAEKRLGFGDIEKVLLVGGTTLISGLRELLSDRNDGLGIPLESSIDPLTVVARGAAIVAGAQIIKYGPNNQNLEELFVELDYEPIGPDEEFTIAGKVQGNDINDFAGHTIQFINKEARPEWRSGKIQLNKDGGFYTDLWAEKGRKNLYIIEVCNSEGTQQKCIPEACPYTINIKVSDIPLTHSIGVALANNETDFYFEKGVSLPVRKRKIHHTVVEISKGQEGDLIRIPVVEGENQRRADRNRVVGVLNIHATNIRRSIPAGSEIEVTIDIDKSHQFTTKAYIPIIDEEFDSVIKWDTQNVDTEKLKSEIEKEKERLESKREEADSTNDDKVSSLFKKIEDENILHEIESAFENAEEDKDSAAKCTNRLLDLKMIVDDLEDILKWPTLVSEAEEAIDLAERIVSEYGLEDDKKVLKLLKSEIENAIEVNDHDLLSRKVDEIWGLRFRVLRTVDAYWVNLFERMQEQKDDMRNNNKAEEFISQGIRAISNNDIESLKVAADGLLDLLPVEIKEGIESSIM